MYVQNIIMCDILTLRREGGTQEGNKEEQRHQLASAVYVLIGSV